MIHPNAQADGLHQLSPDHHILIRQGQPTHTIRITWHEGVRTVHVETHNQPTGGHMNIELSAATIAKLELGPNDTLVVRSDRKITAEQATELQDHVRAIVGDHKIIVLPPSLSLEVLATEAT